MSVTLTPLDPPPSSDEDETVNISNGEWAAIVAASRAFGIEVPKFEYHDPLRYTPEVLRQMADRIEQLEDAPRWLRWLADNGGAMLS